MMNYIRAEFYKVFRRKYTWVTLAVVLALEALLVSGWVFTNAHGNHVDFYTGAVMLTQMLSFGFFASMITCDMVFAGQYKNSTLKNEVSFGLPRGRIYLGKLAVQTILSLLFCVVMLAFYLGLCYVTLYRDPAQDLLAMKIVGYCLLCSLPLWLGVQAVCCACMFLIKSELGSAVIAVMVFYVSAYVLDLGALLCGNTALGTALRTIYNYMPSTLLAKSSEVVGDWAFCGQTWLIGMLWLVVFTAIGLMGFQKKEIK